MDLGAVKPNQVPDTFVADLAALIVAELHLEINPAEIDPDGPLFNEGLGLDSIDALELAVAISRRYGVELRSDDARNHRIFASLRSLAAHVSQRAALRPSPAPHGPAPQLR